MAPTTYAQDRMQELLTGATLALAQTRTGHAAPTHILRTHGPPVVATCDDSLLAVYLADPAIRFVAARRGVQSGPSLVMAVLCMNVEVWRCVPGLGPDGEEPSDAALDASAAALAADGWALWTGLKQQNDANTLFPGVTFPKDVEITTPSPRPPSGRAGGWRITVEVPAGDIGPP